MTVVNESVAISRSRDKLRSLQLLARKGIGLPVTGFAHSTKFTQDLIGLVGGSPLVVKLLEGTQGIGVVLAETNKAAESVIEAFKGLKANILVQEYIKEASGSELPAASRGASLFFLPLDGGGLRWGWGGYRSSPSPNPSRQGRGIIRMPFIPVASHGASWHVLVISAVLWSVNGSWRP